MCGIVGYVGSREAVPVLLDGLSRLEYRGYDSAGIATLNKGKIELVRSAGKLVNLSRILKEKILAGDSPKGNIGIGHTRWATHGRPSEENAHPHRAGKIAVVHNGIIENYVGLKKELMQKGHAFQSETDSEVISWLIQQKTDEGHPMREAFPRAMEETEGSYALVALDQDSAESLFVARRGSPLVIGLGQGENFVASDVPALLPCTRQIIFLEDGDWGQITAQGIHLFDRSGKPVSRTVKEIRWTQEMAEKGGFKHFMQKEIFEQPHAVADTLAGRLRKQEQTIDLEEIKALCPGGVFPFDKIVITACGTSYHAGLVAQYWIETFCQVPVWVDLASEFRYRNPVVDGKTLLVVISQSGETADSLAALEEGKRRGVKVLSVCNVIDSSIPRASHTTLYTHAGPEISVASTKAFTTQLTALLMISLFIGHLRGKIAPALFRKACEALEGLASQMEVVLKRDGEIRQLAESCVEAPAALYLGRGVSFPVALEGALKMKEIAYIHAAGYAAGEMKHGPIALVNDGMPVIVLAPQDSHYKKVLSNIEVIRARGGRVIALGTEGDRQLVGQGKTFLIPACEWFISPILFALPLQLLAYHLADLKGTDVDQPRNLAKSVTVE
ncbi:MAG: glutamine--fructose-6-phosphate transaminase (isomerizing) [Deltaproteobacteria bacterium]|nr:glutamine--fructose-6-phosphate transaminase (isomerizing) [Deltaproteobacteria bacterium]